MCLWCHHDGHRVRQKPLWMNDFCQSFVFRELKVSFKIAPVVCKSHSEIHFASRDQTHLPSLYSSCSCTFVVMVIVISGCYVGQERKKRSCQLIVSSPLVNKLDISHPFSLRDFHFNLTAHFIYRFTVLKHIWSCFCEIWRVFFCCFLACLTRLWPFKSFQKALVED